jgi:hypothetical protein
LIYVRPSVWLFEAVFEKWGGKNLTRDDKRQMQ